MNIRDVVEAAGQAGVKLIRFEYRGVSGVARTKAIRRLARCYLAVRRSEAAAGQAGEDLDFELPDHFYRF